MKDCVRKHSYFELIFQKENLRVFHFTLLANCSNWISTTYPVGLCTSLIRFRIHRLRRPRNFSCSSLKVPTSFWILLNDVRVDFLWSSGITLLGVPKSSIQRKPPTFCGFALDIYIIQLVNIVHCIFQSPLFRLKIKKKIQIIWWTPR